MTESLYLQHYMPSTAAYAVDVFIAKIDDFWQLLTGVSCPTTVLLPNYISEYYCYINN